MSLSKYRDAVDMPPPPRVQGADLADRIRALWARAFAFCPLDPPRGVQRFRSIEEAGAARDRATTLRMRQLRETRQAERTSRSTAGS